MYICWLYDIFRVTGKWNANSNFSFVWFLYMITQPAFTCSKLTIETLEQDAKYVQS